MVKRDYGLEPNNEISGWREICRCLFDHISLYTHNGHYLDVTRQTNDVCRMPAKLTGRKYCRHVLPVDGAGYLIINFLFDYRPTKRLFKWLQTPGSNLIFLKIRRSGKSSSDEIQFNNLIPTPYQFRYQNGLIQPLNCFFDACRDEGFKVVWSIFEPDCKFSVLCINDCNLKRLTTIFLTSLILGSAAGMTVAFHYCGRSLQDINVIGKAKSCCGGLEMPGGCCHDEKVEIKSDNYQLAQPITNAGFIPTLICEFAYPILDFTSQFEKVQTSHLFYQDNSPPPGGPDIVILTQSFLI